MSSTGESISRFTEAIGDTVLVTFKNISIFIDMVFTFFITSGFWLTVFSFILIFLLMIFSPLLLVKFSDNIKKQYTKLINRFIKGISNNG